MTTPYQYSIEGFDHRILDLIPHRPPMLLINQLLNVQSNCASALIYITEASPFYCLDLGVPSWVGLEYMGQTAALIGGYQQTISKGEPQVGFLLGTRAYQAELAYFSDNSELLVECNEKAAVGEGLAQFECRIFDGINKNQCLASANLSVLRKPAASLK